MLQGHLVNKITRTRERTSSNLNRCFKVADQDGAEINTRALLEVQTRVLGERLSLIKAAQEGIGGRMERSVSGDQPSYLDGPANRERAGPASGRRGGVTTDILLPAVGEVRISTFAISPRGRSSIKTADPQAR